ncbi:hypothetical protein MAR_027064 [Mya arenaria]|uniref:Uncharacterized protein n=1 Tax=Mya arenaria TaxID=6604 RepID=A0ABY7EUU3_MYAAR|nr:hypothetical protein MAR_027064 [Mya arenaria]
MIHDTSLLTFEGDQKQGNVSIVEKHKLISKTFLTLDGTSVVTSFIDTGERFFTCMNPLVALEVGADLEPCLTLPAVEGLIPRVCPQVNAQLGLVPALVLAYLTAGEGKVSYK